MHLLSSLLAAACVETVLALPHSSQPVKRGKTFSVTQEKNPNYTFNPKNAVEYGRRKYALKTTGQSSDAAYSMDKDMEYVCPVTIGGQEFKLDFDTGSSDLWVFGEKANNATYGQRAYNATASKTAKRMEGEKWDIIYGDQSGGNGSVWTDVVSVGGLEVAAQAVEVADYTIGMGTLDGDGLLGLGWPNGNTIKPTKQQPFFFNALSDLEAPLFTVDLKFEAPGTYDFGFIDSSKYKGNLHYIPITSQNSWWQFPSPTYSIGSTSYALDANTYGIADTGTTLLVVPDYVAAQVYADVPGADLDIGGGVYTFPCGTPLPPFTVAVGTGYNVTIPPELMYRETQDPKVCMGAVGPGAIPMKDRSTVMIFGDILFKSQFVVFDARLSRIGLAEKA